MPIQLGELHKDSGSGDAERRVYRWYLQGESNRPVAEAHATATIPIVTVQLTGNLWRQPLSFNWEASTYCVVTATYTREKNQTGSFTWDFDTTGGTVNVKASKSTVNRYPNPGAADHEGAIGVNGDEVEGTEVIIPALKFNVNFRHPLGSINLAKVFQLADATGSVNSDTFFTKPAGSFLFLGATGSDGSEAEASVSYQYAYSKNLAAQVIGGIEGVTKDGWDYAWIEFESDTDDSKPIRKPLAVHVERVYDRVSYGSLFGFS